MDLDWLLDFQALAGHANFSRAAGSRNVTQPAFSRRIRALEDWIGTPLFTRSAQGATLTPAGEHFAPMAANVLQNLETARRETRRLGGQQTASLSVAATHALSFTFFPGWINQHLGQGAPGTLNLVSDSLEACEQIMLGGEVHFLLCHHHEGAPVRFDAARFESRCVGHDTLVALSAPDAGGKPMWPVPGTAEKPSRILAYSAASGLGRILMAHPAGPAAHAGTQTVFTSHLAATLRQMAGEGYGAAWLPLGLVEDDLRQGRLVRAARREADIPIEIRLFRSPSCRNPAADRLWAALQDPEVPAVAQHSR